MKQNQSIEALVVKRRNTGEADRVVTLLTRDQGKMVCLAKGVRKISSSRAAVLEPGNHVKCLLVSTKSMPLLTQATLIADSQPIHSSLSKLRQLTQVLEIIDQLFVEEEMEEGVFDQLLEIRALIVNDKPTPASIKDKLAEMITGLGYQHVSETQYQTLHEYVSSLSDKPMKAWEYLAVK